MFFDRIDNFFRSYILIEQQEYRLPAFLITVLTVA